MRKVLISAILAASTLAIAAPAAAAQLTVSVGTQYGSPYGNYYGSQYGNQYGNAYGYDNRGQVRSLMVRINQIERQIEQLDRRNILSNREARQLGYQANMLERQLRQASYNGLNGYERRNFEVQIARLEQNIRYQANDGNRWGSNRDDRGSWNDQRNWQDRDRDGRNDRYEDDRGYDHD
ncbi:hypothetical protein [Sphingomonas sp.]|uniref:hypothetical protein n=1 Tax=Sphingomonas sp. TaxID=28214 RepID=UPI00286C1CC5|nr:hypothetical protein [Sphingomonas sp.]